MKHFTGNEVYFPMPISCQNINGCSYKVAAALSFSWLVGSRSISAWTLCLGFIEVLHCKVLWNWEPNWFHFYFNADCWTFRWKWLHYRLLWNQTYKTITNETFKKNIIHKYFLIKEQIWASLILIKNSQHVHSQIFLSLSSWLLFGFYITFCCYFCCFS